MKVLMVHKFFYVEGGAERYVFNLSNLLEANGDTVIPFAMKHPRNFDSKYSNYFVSYFNPDSALNLIRGVGSVTRVIYNVEARRKIEQLIEETAPEIAHVHSVYHHVSPSVLFSLKKYKLPVVLTLHCYKLICPSFLFLDGDGKICESCKESRYWRAISKRCFKNSLLASTLVSAEAYLHKFLKTYKRNVDLFISPSNFLREKMTEYGFDGKKIVALPYTIPVDEYVPKYDHSNYFVFVGRLSKEKGIAFLINAMRLIKDATLYVIGTGGLRSDLEKMVKENSLDNVKFIGYLSGDELKSVIQNSMFTVVPSIVYDNSPLAVYESFALGKPVVGARIGGIPELIDEGVDGWLFEPNNEKDLAEKINFLLKNPEKIGLMGKNARRKAEQLFSPDAHYARIKSIYNKLTQ